MADSPWIVEVTEATFEQAVVQRSLTTPVLVDFWAPWCNPCRMLGPLLEKLANEMQGRFILAKINADQAPRLGRQYRVQGIPACKLFVGGAVVDEFTGALPEGALRQFLDRAIPSAADRLVEQAELQESQGFLEPARELYQAALTQDPRQPFALIGLARLSLQADQRQEALALLQRLDPASAEMPEAKALRAQLAFGGADAAQALHDLHRQVAEQPQDLAARLALGRALVAAQRVAEGLDQFLEVVRQDRQFDDQAGRRATIQVFEMLGPTHPLVMEYRPRLSALLFS